MKPIRLPQMMKKITKKSNVAKTTISCRSVKILVRPYSNVLYILILFGMDKISSFISSSFSSVVCFICSKSKMLLPSAFETPYLSAFFMLSCTCFHCSIIRFSSFSFWIVRLVSMVLYCFVSDCKPFLLIKGLWSRRALACMLYLLPFMYSTINDIVKHIKHTI